MELTIKINLDNAAFEHGARREVTRILDDLTDRKMGKLSVGDGGKLFDVNGSSVGAWEITE